MTFAQIALFLLKATALTLLLTLAYVVIRTCISVVIGDIVDCMTEPGEDDSDDAQR